MSQLTYDQLIAKGKVPGARHQSSYGVRTSTGSEEDYPVWPDGQIALPPAGGLQMTVVSDDAADDIAGTGARVLQIHYLNGSYMPKVENVEMDGETPVLTVAEDIMWIQCTHIHDVGTGKKTAGDITVTNAGTTYSIIKANKVRCSSSFRMVPAGKTVTILGAVGSSISGTAATRTELNFVANRLDAHSYHDPLIFIPFSTIGLQDNALGFNFPESEPFPEKTLIGMTHSSDKGCTVGGTWFGRGENAQ